LAGLSVLKDGLLSGHPMALEAALKPRIGFAVLPVVQEALNAGFFL